MRMIDADALKDYIDCGHLRPPTELCFSELDVCNMIDKAPTIGGWTPCSERLPEVGHIVLITVKSTLSDDYYVMWANVGKILNKGSLLDGIRFYTEQYGDINEQHGFKVIAWMPLPEPYREDGEE